MRPLRTLSSRPDVVVPLTRDTQHGVVGLPRPFGNQRWVAAIPTNESQTGPYQLTGHRAFIDPQGFMLVDPTDYSIPGRPAIYVHRMLWARWVQDTRRLT